MKLDVTSLDAVEKLNERWDGPNPANGISAKWRRVEHIIHDLCHAAVMRRTKQPPEMDLAGCITKLFDNYDDNPIASDMSEIRALAVEELVLKGVGAPPYVFAAVLRSGTKSNLRRMWSRQAKEVFAVARREATVPRRAALVLRWLREAVTS